MAFALAIRRRPITHGKRPSTWADVFGGLAHVWKTKVMLGLITIDLFAVLLGRATALMPIFAKNRFNWQHERLDLAEEPFTDTA